MLWINRHTIRIATTKSSLASCICASDPAFLPVRLVIVQDAQHAQVSRVQREIRPGADGLDVVDAGCAAVGDGRAADAAAVAGALQGGAARGFPGAGVVEAGHGNQWVMWISSVHSRNSHTGCSVRNLWHLSSGFRVLRTEHCPQLVVAERVFEAKPRFSADRTSRCCGALHKPGLDFVRDTKADKRGRQLPCFRSPAVGLHRRYPK